MNKKNLITIGILVIGIVLILGFSLLNPKSKEVIVINGENDLEAAVGKSVLIGAELYADKLPILKFGNTSIYLWEKGENILSDNSRAVTILRESGISRWREESVKVKVWGKLGKYESTHPADQLIHGHYEIEYYRMEVDE